MSNNTPKVAIVALPNGSFVIGKVQNEDKIAEGSVILERPEQIALDFQQDERGQIHPVIVHLPYAPFVRDNAIDFQLSQVLWMEPANAQITEQYLERAFPSPIIKPKGSGKLTDAHGRPLQAPEPVFIPSNDGETTQVIDVTPEEPEKPSENSTDD